MKKNKIRQLDYYTKMLENDNYNVNFNDDKNLILEYDSLEDYYNGNRTGKGWD